MKKKLEMLKDNRGIWVLLGACGICFAILIFVIFGGLLIFAPHVNNSTRNTLSNIGINLNQSAPNLPITLVNGTSVNLSDFRGRPVVLWFMVTWCSSCAYGAQLLALQYYSKIHAKGAVILTVELYNNLGASGPTLQSFANQYGGGLNKTGWLYGTTTQNATYEYDPNAFLDIYYVINSNGIIVNEGPELSANLDNIVSSI